MTARHEGCKPTNRGVGSCNHGEHDFEEKGIHITTKSRHGSRDTRIVFRIVEYVASRATTTLTAFRRDGSKPRTIFQVHQLNTERRFSSFRNNSIVWHFRSPVIKDALVFLKLGLNDLSCLLCVIVSGSCIDERETGTRQHLHNDRFANAHALCKTTRRND